MPEVGGTIDRVNPNTDDILAMRDAAPDGPVVMVNLMKCRGPAEQEKFVSEVREIFGLIAAKIGAEMLYAGIAGAELIQGEEWDFMALVRCPSYQAFVDLITDPIWQERAADLRRECLTDARLLLTTPVG